MMCGPNTNWLPARRPPPLAAGEVHVWRVTVGSEPGRSDYTLLSEEERRRAEAFRFPADQARYVTARGWLRRRLGDYIGREPSALEFTVGLAGKPALRRAAGDPDVRFNVSHSGAVALLAFTVGVEVGVDVEVCRPEVEFIQLATRFFARDEMESVRDAPMAERTGIFYDIWCRKEACVKATGAGLGIELDGFSVRTAGQGPVRIVVEGGDVRHEMMLYALPPVEGCRASLATIGAIVMTPVCLMAEGDGA